MNVKKQKVAVLGAGIIGVNCAFELQQQGFDVTLIDQKGIGEGCSKGNAGHFATEQVFPLADPILLSQIPSMLIDPNGPIALSFRYIPKVLPWFSQFICNMRTTQRDKNTRALRSLNTNAIKHYKVLLDKIGAQHLLTCSGSLLVFENTPLAQINKIALQYRQQDIPLEVLNRQQSLVLEPNLSKTIQYAIFFTDVAHTVDPYLLCNEIAKAAIEQGAQFVKADIKQVEQTQDHIVLHSETSKMEFDRVVIATGARSKPLLTSLGYKLPIEAERGYHYQLGHSNPLNLPVASAERKFIMTPMSEGLRLAGTVEFSGLETPPNYQRANALLHHAKQILKTCPAQLPGTQEYHQWQGARPSLPDSLPVIGKAPNHQHIYFALGHQHLGLTQGAITGKLIHQCMTGKKTDVDISPFCISRFN